MEDIRHVDMHIFITNISWCCFFVDIVNILYYPQAFTWQPGATLGSAGSFPWRSE